MDYIVNFKTKKRMIVASMELLSKRQYLGEISDNVSHVTLKHFKDDMYALAERLVSLNLTEGEAFNKESHSTSAKETMEWVLGAWETRTALTEKGVEPTAEVPEKIETVVADTQVSETVTTAIDDSQTTPGGEKNGLMEAILSVPAEFFRLLMSKSQRNNNRFGRRYHDARCPDAIYISTATNQTYCPGFRSPEFIASNLFRKLVKNGAIAVPVYSQPQIDLLVKLIKILQSDVPVSSVGSAAFDWLELLKNYVNDKDFLIIQNILKTDTAPKLTTKKVPTKHVVINWEEAIENVPKLSDRLKKFLFTRTSNSYNAGNRLSRRRLSDKNPDSLVVVGLGNKRIYKSFSYTTDVLVNWLYGELNKNAILANDTSDDAELVSAIKTTLGFIVDYLRTLPKPALGTAAAVTDWEQLFAERGYTLWENAETTTTAKVETKVEPEPKPVSVVGFTVPTALAKMEALPLGDIFARKNWPWFFDTSGRFDYIQLVTTKEQCRLYVKSRYKDKAPQFTDIDQTYVSVRNAVSIAYAAGVLGTGIENYPAVETLLKEYCDAFAVATLLELNLKFLQRNNKAKNASTELMPTYLNFETTLDREEILNRLTYPSGRCRVISLGKSSEGIFWYVKSNKIGMGPTLKPKRIRYGVEAVETQIDQLTEELCTKTNLPKDPVLLGEVKEILQREAYRVVSGLV